MAKRRNRQFHPLRPLFVLVLLLTLVWWGNNALQTEEFSFSSPQLPQGFDGCRIVVLSDLHGKEFGKDNARLLAAVAEAAPDYIFLLGDLIDAHTEAPEAYVSTLAAALSRIAPTYSVTGNHEWACGNETAERVKSVLRTSGVEVLTNEFLPLTRGEDIIYLAGIDDPLAYADQKSPEAVAQELYAAAGDPFWLLLAHRNNRFNGGYCRLGADLTFSGHGHGGILRLPLLGGLLGTDMRLFPSFTSGFYTCDDEDCEGASVFVSRGLGNSPRYLPRILNRPQIAVVTLQKEN